MTEYLKLIITIKSSHHMLCLLKTKIKLIPKPVKKNTNPPNQTRSI